MDFTEKTVTLGNKQQVDEVIQKGFIPTEVDLSKDGKAVVKFKEGKIEKRTLLKG